jgi:hypothetical protein
MVQFTISDVGASVLNPNDFPVERVPASITVVKTRTHPSRSHVVVCSLIVLDVALELLGKVVVSIHLAPELGFTRHTATYIPNPI